MRYIDQQTPASAVLQQPDAKEAIGAIAPELLASPMLTQLADFPFGSLVSLILGEGDPRKAAVLEAVAAFEDLSPLPPQDPAIVASRDYEADDVAPGSATVEVPGAAALHERVDIVLRGPSHGNPFVDVELTAVFALDGATLDIGGFYDGDGVYRLRFLPPAAGRWTFTTESTARSLDGIQGVVDVSESDARGPVRVSGRGFRHADGTPFVPVGTTSYAWTHQPEELQEETLRSLEAAPFNKLRMGLFPKSFLFNSNEPDRFVFERAEDGGFDTTRFDLEYFSHLERRIDDLARLGIDADVILFHPYDRWGFATLGPAADDRYVSYVVRRLSAFPNVWWSMANEYDLLTAMRREDWDRLAALVIANDPVGHPLSIHNWVEIFDYSAEWATHASIQGGGREMAQSVAKWRNRWDKPIVVDEFGYEGDIDQGWGNLTAEEVVRRFWEATLQGAFLTHGETFWSDDEVIFWAKGGTLRGESLPRLAFLRELIEAAPAGRITPLPSDWDFATGGGDGYALTYFSDARPRFRTVRVPEKMRAKIDVIDTWAMTIEELPGVHEGDVRAELPARPYIAVRVRAAD
ncbi:DUF5605 domain-containing protein [Microbacterium yannicii]|uniref:DUF5605 domain-containing protein n=1 Tax=Microbacterium yannicii TaxID=671622 RepID=UPI0002FF277E|nr:DUF5605 domain-containing protein [Microbacterium yannicii]